MEIEIKLPELGDGIESGDILDVLVSVGDCINAGDDIVEIETDKASVAVPSSHGGVVANILATAGSTVAIGSVLLTLTAEEEVPVTAVTDSPDEAGSDESPGSDPSEEATITNDEPSQEELLEETREEAIEQPVEPIEAAPQATPDASAPSPPVATSSPETKPLVAPQRPSTTGSAGNVAAGPAIRRFAREVGVDLTTITGTGEGDRITRDDVLSVVRQANQMAYAMEDDENKSTASKAPGEPGNDEYGPVHVQKLSKIRKTIANQMHLSWTTAPRVTNFDDADVSSLEKIRRNSKQDYLENGIKLTSMPFIIKAVAMALRDHPVVNASLDLDNDRVIYKDYVNIGIAIDSDRGLVVPVLRNADRKSIADIAHELGRLATDVHESSFGMEDLRGGSFTISNLGAIGGSYATPIINVPEVAILLIGRTRKMPVVKDDEVVIREMMPLSLSYDHRIVDGADAARFLNDVISYLEAPSRLLLAP
ncbi:MAG TPA: pyruvate dehydrogenase [Planctomycetaceae bacterium]|nr:pyruvate dehydrogenase [Planctomycetaceae bacterium]HCP83750.1 pyruvate dehydrogenase [Planctomycetaceae bacterium]|tara:strand:+ start:3162 stop:4604 length:1443 start_codon:yes stop_codon:yes gene_type:complete